MNCRVEVEIVIASFLLIMARKTVDAGLHQAVGGKLSSSRSKPGKIGGSGSADFILCAFAMQTEHQAALPELRALQSARGRQTAADFVADVLRFRESLQLKISGGLTPSRAIIAASSRFLDRCNVRFVTPLRIRTVRIAVRLPIAGDDHVYGLAERRFGFKLDIQLGARDQVPVHDLVNLCPVGGREFAVTAQLRLIFCLNIHFNSSFFAA
jgi:hypothetical protein